MSSWSIKDSEECYVDCTTDGVRSRDTDTTSSIADPHHQYPQHQGFSPVAPGVDVQPLMSNEYIPDTFESTGQYPQWAPVTAGDHLPPQQYNDHYHGDFAPRFPTMSPHSIRMAQEGTLTMPNFDDIDATMPHQYHHRRTVVDDMNIMPVDANMYQQGLSHAQFTAYPQQHGITQAVFHPDHYPVAPTDAIIIDRNYEQNNQELAMRYLPLDQQNPGPYPREMPLPVDIPSHLDPAGISMAPRSDNSDVHSRPMLFGHYTISPPWGQPVPPSVSIPAASDHGSCNPLLGGNTQTRHSQQASAVMGDTTGVSANLNKTPRKNARKPRKYLCTTCRRDYKTKGGLRRHEASETCSQYHCPHCNQVFLERKDLDRHISGPHGDIVKALKHKCRSCDYESSRRDNLRRHEKCGKHLNFVPVKSASQHTATGLPHDHSSVEYGGFAPPTPPGQQRELSAEDHAAIQRVIDIGAMNLDKRPAKDDRTCISPPPVLRGPSRSRRRGVLLPIQDNDLGYHLPSARTQPRLFDQAPSLGDASPSMYLASQSAVTSGPMTQSSQASSGPQCSQEDEIGRHQHDEQSSDDMHADAPHDENTDDMDEDHDEQSGDGGFDEFVFEYGHS